MRFNITIKEGVNMALESNNNAPAGEIMVPKISSYRITDMATAINAGCEQRIVGVHPTDKIHESMITSNSSLSTVDSGKYYAILPVSNAFLKQECCVAMKAQLVQTGFAYNSGTNTDFVSVKQLRSLIAQQSTARFLQV